MINCLYPKYNYKFVYLIFSYQDQNYVDLDSLDDRYESGWIEIRIRKRLILHYIIYVAYHALSCEKIR